jgi:hypothetical protein
MMSRLPNHHGKFKAPLFRRLMSDCRASVTVEAAVAFIALTVMLIGVIDFGAAYSQKMSIENAVRAGIQYGTVRKPIQGDLSQITAAVTTASPTPSAGQSNVISVSEFCECANGTASACLTTGGVAIVCADGSTRRSFLKVGLSQQYKLMFTYPGFGSTLALSNTETVRLN